MGSQWKLGLSLGCLFHIPCCQGRPFVLTDVLLLCSTQELRFLSYFDQGSVLFLLLFSASLLAAIPSPKLAVPIGKPRAEASRRGGKNSPEVLGSYGSQHRFAA